MTERVLFDSREAWLEGRKKFLGGSDAAAIIGRNPYKTNVQLWEEKTGLIIPEDISGKAYVKFGHDAEPLMREMFALDHPEYRVEYYGDHFIVNDKFPFAHASLDGELIDQNGRRGILEIKTTNILQSMQLEKWNNIIPDNYYCQLLWYFGVTEYEFACLKARLKFQFKRNEKDVYCQIRHYWIERLDVEDDIQFMMDAGRRFAESVKTKQKPALILRDI